jgi:hypothetical protein
MIVNIAPVASTQAALTTSATRAGTHVPASSPRFASADEPVKVDMIPSSPPPEVHDAIGVAAQSYQKLFASGRELGFGIDPTTRKVVIQVRDTQGNLLWTAPPSKALAIAAGATLD